MTKIKTKIEKLLLLDDKAIQEILDKAFEGIDSPNAVKPTVKNTRESFVDPDTLTIMIFLFRFFELLEPKLESEQGWDLENIYNKYAINEWKWEDEWAPSNKKFLTFEQFRQAVQELQQPIKLDKDPDAGRYSLTDVDMQNYMGTIRNAHKDVVESCFDWIKELKESSKWK